MTDPTCPETHVDGRCNVCAPTTPTAREALRESPRRTFAAEPCACPCGCKEPMRTEEAAFFKGVCIACGGGFHGLQESLRKAGTR
jgi:hypothetical protein